jgi:hypothetical protein
MKARSSSLVQHVGMFLQLPIPSSSNERGRHCKILSHFFSFRPERYFVPHLIVVDNVKKCSLPSLVLSSSPPPPPLLFR